MFCIPISISQSIGSQDPLGGSEKLFWESCPHAECRGSRVTVRLRESLLPGILCSQ